MVAYATRVPAGIPGAITRENSLTVSPELVDSGTPPTAYGSFVKLVAGKLQPLASGDTAGSAMGLLARSYPVQSTTNAMGVATPPTSGLVDVLRRGFMAVALKNGTSVRGGQVYAVTTAAAGVSVGDIVTGTTPVTGATAVAMTGAFFEGAADANGIVEISFAI